MHKDMPRSIEVPVSKSRKLEVNHLMNYAIVTEDTIVAIYANRDYARASRFMDFPQYSIVDLRTGEEVK